MWDWDWIWNELMENNCGHIIVKICDLLIFWTSVGGDGVSRVGFGLEDFRPLLGLEGL